MSLLGTDCATCAHKGHCDFLLGYRTAWCKVESLLENLTKSYYCGTITMKCDYYEQKEENGYGYEL